MKVHVSTMKYTKLASDDCCLKNLHETPPPPKKPLVTCIYLHDSSILFNAFYVCGLEG